MPIAAAEKGFYLIAHIESLVGREPFAAFMHDYIQTFKYKSLTSADFAAYATTYFAEGRHALPRVSHAGSPPVHSGVAGPAVPEDIATLAVPRVGPWPVALPEGSVTPEAAAHAAATAGLTLDVDWDTWFNAPGMPPVKNTYDSAARVELDAHADAWVWGADADATAAVGAQLTATWRAPQWIAFCERLSAISAELAARSPPAIISPIVLHRIDAAYSLSASRNAEIRCAWGMLRVRSGIAAALDDALALLREQGRMKYVRPLFRELMRSSFGREPVLELWESHGCTAYHPICAKMVAADIAKEKERGPAVDASTLIAIDGTTAASDASTPSPSRRSAPLSGPEFSSEEEDAAAGVHGGGVEVLLVAEESAAEAVDLGEELLLATEAGTAEDVDEVSTAAPAGNSSAMSHVDVTVDVNGANESGDVEAAGRDDTKDDDDADEEDEEDDTPAPRIRFGRNRQLRRRTAPSARQRTAAAADIVAPTADISTYAAAATIDEAATTSVSRSPPPTTSPSHASPPPAPRASATSVAVRGGATPTTDAAVLEKRRQLLASAALRAANPSLTPGAAARQVKGLPPHAGAADDGDAGDADEQQSTVARAIAAVTRPLHAGVVSVETADTISTWLAFAVVGGAAAALAMAIYRRML